MQIVGQVYRSITAFTISQVHIGQKVNVVIVENHRHIFMQKRRYHDILISALVCL